MVTPEQVLACLRDIVQEMAHDRALTLALMEKLSQKNQNLGSVRSLEPFLSKEECDAVMKRAEELGKAIIEERQKAAAEEIRRQQSSLLLPPGATR